MMQSADLPNGDNLALRRRFHPAWRWRVAIQRQMWLRVVIILEVRFQNSPQVILIQDDQVVQTFAAYRSNHPFTKRVLPGQPWRDGTSSIPISSTRFLKYSL